MIAVQFEENGQVTTSHVVADDRQWSAMIGWSVDKGKDFEALQRLIVEGRVDATVKLAEDLSRACQEPLEEPVRTVIEELERWVGVGMPEESARIVEV